MHVIIDGKEFWESEVSFGHAGENWSNGSIMTGMSQQLLDAMKENKLIKVKNSDGKISELHYKLSGDSAEITNSASDYLL